MTEQEAVGEWRWHENTDNSWSVLNDAGGYFVCTDKESADTAVSMLNAERAARVAAERRLKWKQGLANTRLALLKAAEGERDILVKLFDATTMVELQAKLEAAEKLAALADEAYEYASNYGGRWWGDSDWLTRYDAAKDAGKDDPAISEAMAVLREIEEAIDG